MKEPFHLHRIEAIEHFIEEHIAEPIRLQDLSDVACLSYHRVRHFFQEMKGECLWQYVKRFRLEYAAGLLKHSRYSITDIGEMSGYATKYSFSKAFRQQFNNSPSTFQQKIELPADTLLASCNPTLLPNLEQCFRSATAQIKVIPAFTFCYRRFSHLEAKGLEEVRATAMQWTSDSSASIMITSPDVICMQRTGLLRLDIGFSLPEKERNASATGFWKKQYPAGRYAIFSFQEEAQKLPLLTYWFIHQGVRTGTFSVRNHSSVVRVQFPWHVELWIPIQ
jgi:AraC-like DNA-binding protein